MQNQSVTEQLFKEMTATIECEIKPRKIILFGSHARGTARHDSDLDFLIIEDDSFTAKRSRRLEMAQLLMLFPNLSIPIVFLVYSSEEVSKYGSSKNHLVSHILREGRTLYEC